MAQVWFGLLLDIRCACWALVQSKGDESEKFAMLGFLAVFVGVHSPFGPALILECFVEGHPKLCLAEGYWHGLESAQRQLFDVPQVVLRLFLLDFFLELGELLSKTGHLAGMLTEYRTSRLESWKAF